MPELPDIVVYLDALGPRILDRRLERVRLGSPFLLRSVAPPITDAEGLTVVELRRLGKRIVIGLEGGLFLVLHLMIAGRLRWRPAGAKLPGKMRLAAFDFDSGTLLLTEASKKKRASLHLVAGERALRAHDRGGLEVLQTDVDAFRGALRRENHTLKRALTDPRLFSGIGNAYSDEILHRARLSPFKQTERLDEQETGRLFEATRQVLEEWTERLRVEC
ncbi:MAG: DNA-formamidopyrimidine glycosylase family protein, partial [Planctomycetota bacterium]